MIQRETVLETVVSVEQALQQGGLGACHLVD
jgi:hypothetical protein